MGGLGEGKRVTTDWTLFARLLWLSRSFCKNLTSQINQKCSKFEERAAFVDSRSKWSKWQISGWSMGIDRRKWVNIGWENHNMELIGGNRNSIKSTLDPQRICGKNQGGGIW